MTSLGLLLLWSTVVRSMQDILLLPEGFSSSSTLVLVKPGYSQ